MIKSAFAMILLVGCGGNDAGEACSERSGAAKAAVENAAATADRSCGVASDCSIVPLGTACSDSCSVAFVSAAGVKSIEGARTDVESRICGNFAADGCKVEALPCSAVAQQVDCVNRQCVAR